MHSTKLSLVKFNRDLFPVLQEWFSKWNWTECDLESIPEESYFVEREGNLIAFSCFLKTDCNLAIMGITITDPEAKGKSEAIDWLLGQLFSRATELGYKYIHYYTDSKPMVDRMQSKHDFLVTDNASAYILLKSLGGKNIDFFDE